MVLVIRLGGKNALTVKMSWPSLHCCITGELRYADLGESPPSPFQSSYLCQLGALKCHSDDGPQAEAPLPLRG